MDRYNPCHCVVSVHLSVHVWMLFHASSIWLINKHPRYAEEPWNWAKQTFIFASYQILKLFVSYTLSHGLLDDYYKLNFWIITILDKIFLQNTHFTENLSSNTYYDLPSPSTHKQCWRKSTSKHSTLFIGGWGCFFQNKAILKLLQNILSKIVGIPYLRGSLFW